MRGALLNSHRDDHIVVRDGVKKIIAEQPARQLWRSEYSSGSFQPHSPAGLGRGGARYFLSERNGLELLEDL